MNHIPGPWFHAKDCGKDKIYANDIYGDPWTIAHCIDPLDGSHPREANAKLIAAAPDLLQALKDIIADMDQQILLPEQLEVIKAEARLAINKAEGKV